MLARTSRPQRPTHGRPATGDGQMPAAAGSYDGRAAPMPRRHHRPRAGRARARQVEATRSRPTADSVRVAMRRAAARRRAATRCAAGVSFATWPDAPAALASRSPSRSTSAVNSTTAGAEGRALKQRHSRARSCVEQDDVRLDLVGDFESCPPARRLSGRARSRPPLRAPRPRRRARCGWSSTTTTRTGPVAAGQGASWSVMAIGSSRVVQPSVRRKGRSRAIGPSSHDRLFAIRRAPRARCGVPLEGRRQPRRD